MLQLLYSFYLNAPFLAPVSLMVQYVEIGHLWNSYSKQMWTVAAVSLLATALSAGSAQTGGSEHQGRIVIWTVSWLAC